MVEYRSREQQFTQVSGQSGSVIKISLASVIVKSKLISKVLLFMYREPANSPFLIILCLIQLPTMRLTGLVRLYLMNGRLLQSQSLCRYDDEEAGDGVL